MCGWLLWYTFGELFNSKGLASGSATQLRFIWHFTFAAAAAAAAATVRGRKRHFQAEKVEEKFFEKKFDMLPQLAIERSILRWKVRRSVAETTLEGGHLGKTL